MSIDQLQRRDRRIAELEALGRHGRTRGEDHELGQLIDARDQLWRRLPARIDAARRRAHELEAYARQAGFAFPERIIA